MITDLSISHFKSIRDLGLKAKKINVFIGEPNAGKSNIIEALSLLSNSRHQFRNYVRFKDLTDLFFDNQINTPIKIFTGITDLEINFSSRTQRFDFIFSSNKHTTNRYEVDISGQGSLQVSSSIRFYKYNQETVPNHAVPGQLLSPFGENLVSILMSNAKVKKTVSELFRSKGFRMNLKPIERELLISKEKGDEIYSYPYNNISETLRRIVFLMTCLETNENSTILFDEPESNTFPFYTKYLAERIAMDETNQYFFTTHNPYLLQSVVAKGGHDNVNIIITYMKDFETRVRPLNSEEINELMDMDAFLNLTRFIG
jgi:AAA15 family ATPase/GTPase